MSGADASEMSKSARKRANQKARAEGEVAEVAAPPAPAPKAKAAGKAAAKAAAAPAPEPAQAKAKAKGKAKAAAAPEPAPAAVVAPKSKAKAKAKAADPKAAAAPEPEAKAAAKPNAKKAAKKAKAEEEAPKKAVVEEATNFEMDDGTGGDWGVASGLSGKAQKRKEKAEAQQQAEEDEKKALKAAGVGKASNQHIPGMASSKELLAAAKAGKSGAGIVVAKVSEYKATKPELGAAKAPEPVAEKPTENLHSASIKVPQEKIGRVIGPKGSNITLLKEKTGVKTIDTADGLVTIVGEDAAGVKLCEHAVNELITKGYMSLSFEDFKEEGVAVLPHCVPDIIGQRGAIIQVIKKECKVEIDIGDSKNLKPGQKVKVSIAGGAEGVAKAQEIIHSIAAFSHHEVTHPGFAHSEMEVEEWKYRFLIGKGGSEMRHIQNNFKVKVNIPRETSTTDKVVVIGEERDVEKAVKYIEKVLFEADQVKADPRADKAEDTWGAEEPEEAWMSPYMYKRR